MERARFKLDGGGALGKSRNLYGPRRDGQHFYILPRPPHF